jgi:N-acetylglucosamine-6-phosphate deacetylase
MADRKGSLEQGKDADIIITDENFEVKKTIIRGEIKYEA